MGSLSNSMHDELNVGLPDSVHREKLEGPNWFDITEGFAHGLTYLQRFWEESQCNALACGFQLHCKLADFDLASEYNRNRSHESTQKTSENILTSSLCSLCI
jgi:hypothetical protein